MNNELMNMQDVREKIVESVKVNFFNLISEHKFQKLVNDEINEFFEATTKEFKVENINNYDKKITRITTPISPFRALVWEQCNLIVSSKIQKYFQGPDYQISTKWDDQELEWKNLLSEKFEKVLEEKANKLAATFFKDMFSMALQSSIPEVAQQIKNNITQGF